ncbi:MAG TPA: hypothetical protein VKR58_08405, partial [Aquella sp.]|nr:hypothetical protein [Aquella sp.]
LLEDLYSSVFTSNTDNYLYFLDKMKVKIVNEGQPFDFQKWPTIVTKTIDIILDKPKILNYKC